MNSSCSLIFINWNTPDLTLQAVDSAVKSTGDPRMLRFIVVDNGSEDDSCNRIRAAHPEIQLIEMGRNAGFAAAANAGLAATDTPYAFICNTDILFQPNAIEQLIEALENDDRAVLACPELLREDGTKQAAAVPEPAIVWEWFNRSLPRRFLKIDPRRPTPVPTVVGPCMALHRNRLQSVGTFDDTFFFFFEETDLCRRINRSGQRCLLVPQAQVIHFQGKSANTRPVRARIQFFQSRYRYFRKHTGLAGMTLLGIGLFFKLLANTLLYNILGLGSPRLRDKAAVSRSLLLWHLKGCPDGHGLKPATSTHARK